MNFNKLLRICVEFQNGWVWKVPLEVLPGPFCEAGLPLVVAQDPVQVAFQYHRGWRLQNLSGQFMPVYGPPGSKKVLPHVQVGPFWIWLCGHWLLSCSKCQWGEAASIVLSALQVLIRTPLSLIFSRLSLQLFQSVLTPEMLHVPSSSLWPFAGLCPVCPWVWGAWNWTGNSRCDLTRAE